MRTKVPRNGITASARLPACPGVRRWHSDVRTRRADTLRGFAGSGPPGPGGNVESAVMSGIRSALAFLIGSLLALSAGAGQYDPTLQYQLRGDRVEGLRTIDVDGLDVELLSVRIDAPEFESTQTWAERLRAR